MPQPNDQALTVPHGDKMHGLCFSSQLDAAEITERRHAILSTDGNVMPLQDLQDKRVSNLQREAAANHEALMAAAGPSYPQHSQHRCVPRRQGQ